MLPAWLSGSVTEHLTTGYGIPVWLDSFTPLSGESINNSGKLETNSGPFFLKYNINQPSDFFIAEANGLQLLSTVIPEAVPSVIGRAQENWLLLEYIDSKPFRPDDNFQLGVLLARLHLNLTDEFGLNESNYIGSLRQINSQKSNWIDFFVENRLEPLFRKAIERKLLDSSITENFQRLYKSLDSIFPTERASLLHGDLWSGNKLNSASGPYFIDPAVYYGHREMDIAMTKLFGGFSEPFYEGYESLYPLEKGWEDRVDICNLYPLLVHVNLFGGGYGNQVKQIVTKF